MSASGSQLGSGTLGVCAGVDLSLTRYEPDETVDERLSGKLELTPQERLLAMLGEPGAGS